jgi:hypothetical protein
MRTDGQEPRQVGGGLSSLTRRDGVPSPLSPTELSRCGAALGAHEGELDQIRPRGSGGPIVI